MHGEPPIKEWDGMFACLKYGADVVFRTNITQGMASCYAYSIITRGWMELEYGGRSLFLRANDVYIYTPGMQVTVTGASADLTVYCVLAEESMTLETSTVYNLVRIAYLPIVQLREPKFTFPCATIKALTARIDEILNYLHSDHIHKAEILRMLYAVFLLDLQNAQAKAIVYPLVPQRVEEIFLEFIGLLPHHFAEHHDIAFYAAQLNITTTYLSRVVRNVTGRTVMDYVNQFLVMEAAFLLRNTRLSIAQVADRLHFADAASFSKFFSRHKGLTPRDYRNA